MPLPLGAKPPTPPNYNEALAKAVPGTPYRRVRFIGIANDKSGIPHVQLVEEDVAYLADGSTTPVQGGYAETISVPVDAAELARAFGLLNPADDTAIPGEGTGGQIFMLLYSWARSHQRKRDAYQPPKRAFAFDADGTYTGSVWVACNEDGSFTLPPNTTFTTPPAAYLSQEAKWDGTAWTIA